MSRFNRASRFWSLCAIGSLTAMLGVSCSTSGGGQTTSGGSGGNGGHGGSTGGAESTGTGGDLFHTGSSSSSSSSSGGLDVDAGCAGEATTAQQLPLDMFIMLDRSYSMRDKLSGGTDDKWVAVTSALKAFVAQPGLSGVSVGLQYFPVAPSQPVTCACTKDADCGYYGPCLPFLGCAACALGGVTDSCDALDYAKPAVEIAPLPGAAVAIINSINTAANQPDPGASTPTSPALQGAINHATTWANSHPSHVVITVLATDGDPTECDTSLTNINAIAASGANANPKVLTFVIGVGSSFQALNGIAAAGGTTKAFLVDTNPNANTAFLAALNEIRGAALGCQYKIPQPAPPAQPDYSKVNVQYAPGNGGAPETLLNVQDKAHCPSSGDAWYYDDPTTPTLILLCPSTCNKVSSDGKGEVDVVLGCATVVN